MALCVRQSSYPVCKGFPVLKEDFFAPPEQDFTVLSPVYWAVTRRRDTYVDYVAAKVSWVTYYLEDVTFGIEYVETSGHICETRVGPNDLLKRHHSQALQFTTHCNDESDWVTLYPYQRENVDHTRGDPRLCSTFRD